MKDTDNLVDYERIININRALMSRITPRPSLFFDIEVTEHCNLNCKSCGSFAPLADEEYIDIDELDRDLRRLSELSDGEVHHINILGGEPLLHPEIARIVEIKNNVIAHGIQYQSFGQAADGWYHTVISESGDKNEIQQFLHCSNANNCTVLEHGKLYPCPKAAKVRHFNKAFGDRFQQSSHDYIDIYKAESLKEIMEFLSKPIPFCRYCDTFASEKIEWGVSHKEDSEWT